MTTKTQKKVATTTHRRVNRIMTPELSATERKLIADYHALLKDNGTKVSEGGALLHAAMQTIRREVTT